MKRILLILGVLLLVLTGCAESSVEEIKPQAIIDRFEGGETFAFVIGDETCPACQAYRAGALKEMNKKDEIKLEYIDLHNLTDQELEDARKLVEQDNYLDGEFEVTPTTYFVVDGKLTQVIKGSVSYDELSSGYELVK